MSYKGHVSGKKCESLHMVLVSATITSSLPFFAVLYVDHKFLSARTVIYYEQEKDQAQQDSTPHCGF